MGFIARLLVGCACAGAACWLVTTGTHWAGARIRASISLRRDRAALRAEMARGLAQIEEFLRASSGGTVSADSSDTEAGGAGPGPRLCGGNAAEGSDGSDG